MSTLCVILAAGEGTRMQSSLPKVLHRLAGRPLLGHVLEAARGVDTLGKTIVVVGPDHEAVHTFLESERQKGFVLEWCIQNERKGTAHAVLSISSALLEHTFQKVLILYGDVPLIPSERLCALLHQVTEETPLAVLGFEAHNPFGYGRLKCDSQGRVLSIIEEKEASEEDRKNTLCHSGMMAIDSQWLWRLLPEITPSPLKGEYYLTDLVRKVSERGKSCAVLLCDEAMVLGVNTRAQLAVLESLFQDKKRHEMMVSGVTLQAPETVFFSWDTKIAHDVVIEPHVVMGPGVELKKEVCIRSFSYLEGALVEEGAVIGPFARLRLGAKVGQRAHIGNFVELKNTELGEGVKVNHLAYLGDSQIEQGSNIGAGVITCNYDGVSKHKTKIGRDSFIGTNSALIAPLEIGAGAFIAAGSVVTEDIESDAFYQTRGEKTVRKHWVQRYFQALLQRKRQEK